MSPFKCVREREVTDLLRQGYWPNACTPELRQHVEGCRACADLVLVTQTLVTARKESTALPRLESPGALWWRAQLRRRNAAIEKMARPILGAQFFALAVALVVAVGIGVWHAGNWSEWIANLPQALHLDVLLPTSLAHSDGALWIVVPVLATIALLSGIIAYLATEKQ